MFHTIFQHPAQRCKGAGDFWAALIVVTLILVVGVYVFTDGAYIALGPSPLLIFIIWRLTRNKVEAVTFYVSQNHKNDLVFGYKDSEDKTHGDFPLDEYMYWCVEGTSTVSGWNYELYMQIQSKGFTYYLKEKMVGRRPPERWPVSKNKIKDALGVIYVPQLVELAKMIDRAAVEETATT